MLHTLTTTEREVYDLLNVFQYLKIEQVQEILSATKSKLAVERAIFSLKKNRLIRENKEESIMLTNQTKEMDSRYTDCIWAIMEHLKSDNNDEMITNLMNTFIAKPPALFCYTKGPIAYYILKVTNDVDLNNLTVYQERLDAVGGKNATDSAKMMIVMWDKKFIEKLPPLRYQAMKIVATHKSILLDDKPEFEIIT